MEEEWRDIKGYEGLYQVSNTGLVRSLDRTVTYFRNGKEIKATFKGVILEQDISRYGYCLVKLSKNGHKKGYGVHCLMYKAFIGDIPKGMQVNHINEIKSDNRLENFNLMTPKENTNWGTAIQRRIEKQTNDKRSKPVLQIDKNTNEVIAEFPSIHQVERDLGISISHISACCNNKPHCNTAGGYKWKYKKGDC